MDSNATKMLETIRERWEGYPLVQYCEDWLEGAIRHWHRNEDEPCGCSDDDYKFIPHPGRYDGDIFSHSSKDVHIILDILDTLLFKQSKHKNKIKALKELSLEVLDNSEKSEVSQSEKIVKVYKSKEKEVVARVSSYEEKLSEKKIELESLKRVIKEKQELLSALGDLEAIKAEQKQLEKEVHTKKESLGVLGDLEAIKAEKERWEERITILRTFHSISVDYITIKHKVKSLQDEEKRLQATLTRTKALFEPGRGNDVITLDVGGRKYKTTRATLCKVPSVLSALVSDKNKRYFFIDRSGQHFHHILTLLRDSKIELTSLGLVEALKMELEYFRIKYSVIHRPRSTIFYLIKEKSQE